MINKCCDCKKVLGIRLPLFNFSITHSICKKCKQKWINWIIFNKYKWQD